MKGSGIDGEIIEVGKMAIGVWFGRVGKEELLEV
jgi:hypothetical protein